jgi:hypothetical protein
MKTQVIVRTIHGKDIVAETVPGFPEIISDKMSAQLTTTITNIHIKGENGRDFHVIPVHNIARLDFEPVDDKVVV